MSAPNQTAFAVLSQVALAADGAVLGLALAYIAVRSVLKFKTTSSSLNKVKKAPPASPISFLSSVILLIKSQIRLLSVMRGSSSFEESWRRNPSSTVIGRNKTFCSLMSLTRKLLPWRGHKRYIYIPYLNLTFFRIEFYQNLFIC